MWGRGEDLFGVEELQPPFLSLTMCLRKRSGNLRVEHIWDCLGEYGLELEWTIYNVVLSYPFQFPFGNENFKFKLIN